MRRRSNKYVGDTVLRQLGQADLMLLNKTDLAPDLAAVRSWLQEHGGRAPVFETIRCDVPLAILVGRNAGLPVRAPATRFEASDPAHDLVYRTWTLSRAAPIARATIERWAGRVGGRIFRAKGFVRLAEAPARRHLLQLVGRRWTLEDAGPWDDADRRSRIVCIGKAVCVAEAGLLKNIACRDQSFRTWRKNSQASPLNCRNCNCRIGLKLSDEVLILMPASSSGAWKSRMLVAWRKMFSRERSSPHCLSASTIVAAE